MENDTKVSDSISATPNISEQENGLCASEIIFQKGQQILQESNLPEEETNIVLKVLQDQAEQLTRPTTFMCVGQSQIGKSTFLNKVFGKPVAVVGNTGESCTRSVISIQSESIPWEFIDTPGLFDTEGKLVDKKNRKRIMNEAKKTDKSRDLIILLFSKFETPFTGVLKETIEFLNEIINDRENSLVQIALVLTYSNVTINQFPTNWIKKIKESNNLKGEKLVLRAWNEWKTSKKKFIMKHLNWSKVVPLPVICTDFADYDIYGEETKGLLINGESVMENVAQGLIGLCHGALYLMSRNAPDEKTKKIANVKLSDTLKQAIKVGGVSASTYGVLNGLYVGGILASTAVTGTGALGGGFGGFAAGFAAGTLAAGSFFIPIAVTAGVFYYVLS